MSDVEDELVGKVEDADPAVTGGGRFPPEGEDG